MYFLPLLRRNLTADITQYWFFLERNGTHLMELDATPETVAPMITEFLESNELTPASQYLLSPDGQIAFVLVDPTDPDLASFYSWSDITPGSTAPLKEVWRSFLWNTGSGSLGTNRLLGDILVAPPAHTVLSVLEAFGEACSAALRADTEQR